jgi:hypothetical protein
MFKHLSRKLILAATLTALTGPVVHGQTTSPTPPPTTPTPTPGSVTGGDPEPTSPDIMQIILTILSVA